MALKTSDPPTPGPTRPKRKSLTKSLVTRSIPAVYCACVAPAIVSCEAPGTVSLPSHVLTPGRLNKKQPQKSHLRKPPLASKLIPPSERRRMPAITKEGSEAGTARSMRSPRMALKTSGVCIGSSLHRLSLLDEVLDEPQDARHANQSAGGHCRGQPAAATPPLQDGCDDGY